MAKVKVARKSTAIDMTPMVDLAFLLLTFFMLTTKFRPQEAVDILIPSSIAITPLPATDIMIISVSKDGRVFFGVDSKHTREATIRRIMEKYKLDLSPDEVNIFSIMPQVGLPIAAIPQWLKAKPSDRDKILQNAPGIPCDTTNNELGEWIVASRMSNPQLRIAIKGDVDAPYPVIKKVIDTLQDRNINKFNLITGKEAQEFIDTSKL
jgi:biopolymer transport protein ExbD